MLNIINIKFTPEAFFMIPFALGLDLAGIILFCFGGDDLGILDALGIVFIGFWLLLRGKNNSLGKDKKGAINSIKKFFTGKTSKFIVPAFGELIPYIGAIPFWTISVLLNLSEE
jgi:hypothetical protein